MSEESRITYDSNGDARAFVGPEAVNVFAMAALSSGLRLYAATGMKPNRAWTPTAMMRAARYHLGPDAPKLGTRDYERAAALLAERVQAEKQRLAGEQS